MTASLPAKASCSPRFVRRAVWRYMRHAVAAAAVLGSPATGQERHEGAPMEFWLSCRADNDLYRVLSANGVSCRRHETAQQAVEAAPEGAAVLVLADGYPTHTTSISAALLDRASRRRQRLYVEFPAELPGMQFGPVRRTALERTVVASDAFGEALPAMRILALHDCHFAPTAAGSALLVAARVAGFDRAAYGLQDVETWPLLLEHPHRDLLVCTTKLSQFVTARYAPQDAVRAVWLWVLSWLAPGADLPTMEWQPVVRPSFGPEDALPAAAVRDAIVRGVDWHTRARMLPHASWAGMYDEQRRQGTVSTHNPVAPRPSPDLPCGDGEFGILEGVSSRIAHDGEQPVRWWRRSDSNGESSLAFALRSRLDGDERSARVAANLLDWVYSKSGLFQTDPGRSDFGLVHWAADSTSLYGDNDIKIILGCMGTAALLATDRWDEALVRNILGNFRTTGVYGYRGNALRAEDLVARGWRHFWDGRNVNYAPHYQAWIWAAYLWLYDKTRDPILLERTRRAVAMMMQAYPDRWRWTNGIQQERGRMLLTLAWLVRVDDRPEHREWLRTIAADIARCQEPCGAIREELGELGKGQYRPPQSNAEYGRNEASLIQENGDPVADLLYTCNFSFLGLHEAYAATGEKQYRDMADRLAGFLVRVQVRSDARPELDGGWFRAFDFRQWEYWGSNADAGWGAWSIEVGWTQAWIPTVLALRELGLNLWALTAESRVAVHWARAKELMLAEAAVEVPVQRAPGHAGVGATVTLRAPPDPRYPGAGAAGLVDGLLGLADHVSPEWLGYLGTDVEAIVDLGAVTRIDVLGASFLQSIRVGVFLPVEVEFAASDDGRGFTVLKTVSPDIPEKEPGPLVHTVLADDLKTEARYIRVEARSVGVIPDWHQARGVDAWLFIDEIQVNP